MASFRVRVERPTTATPIVVVDVDGALDEAAGAQLQSLAEAAATLRPTCEVHLNLWGAQAPDAPQAVAMLRGAHQAAARKGCRLRICQPPHELREALIESGLPLCENDVHPARPEPG